MSTASESSPLLSKPSPKQKYQKRCSCRIKYRLPMITEKGAIVVIVCNVLALTAICAQLQNIFSTTTFTRVTFLVMAIITFPIVGIVADTCVGKFRVIQASIAFLMVSSLLNLLQVLLQGYLPTTSETIFILCTTVMCCIGTSCYVAGVFPFAADQLIGASGEQLSFAVYWIMWGLVISFFTILLRSIPSYYFDIVVEAVSIICVVVIAFIFTCFKYLLTIFPHPFNPYKLISEF